MALAPASRHWALAMKQCHLAIVGGGIIGLATAYRYLERHPEHIVVIFEKEATVGAHQTGRNSGVLHSGIYYKPGSLRAANGRAGREAMVAFCREQSLPFEICGKVIVAVDDREVPLLERIHERGVLNGVRCELIERSRLREIEPAANGVLAIHVPDAGIVDFSKVATRLAQIAIDRGGELWLGARVGRIESRRDGVRVASTRGDVLAARVVTCGGLYADRLAWIGGQRVAERIVPFRGEYYELVPDARSLCRNLIYPVPDPAFPFLGVHFTRMIGGHVECGPNAVFAFAREGYRAFDVNVRDLIESLSYPGFGRLVARHWRQGLGEMWRSASKVAFVQALQRLVPAVTTGMLVPARSGVRAQVLHRDGTLADDFVILERERIVSVVNAPSPAATASLTIGRLVVDRLDGQA